MKVNFEDEEEEEEEEEEEDDDDELCRMKYMRALYGDQVRRLHCYVLMLQNN